jgi:glycosyltransferase involved in cell wall biosynthesis
MKILMFSFDRSLLGNLDIAGGTLKRHQEYARNCESLDIVVLTKKGFSDQKISDNFHIRATNSLARGFDVFDALRIAKRIWQKNKFDLVVCQDPFLTGLAGLLAKKKLKTKLIVGLHGDFIGNSNWLRERKYNFILLGLAKYVLKKADTIRVVSKGIKNKLVARNFDGQKIKVIPTPLDVAKFSGFDPETLESLKIKYKTAGEQILLFVGRFETEKNLPWLIDSFAKMSESNKKLRLLMIGAGREENKIKEKINNLGLSEKIFLLGEMSHSDLSVYHYLADIFVLPSLSESFGKVLLEAGSCGLPVVASQTTGATGLVRAGKTGFLFAINNFEDFQSKIFQILSNQELQNQLSVNSRKYVLENFDGQKNIEKIIDMWKGSVNEK